MGIQRLKCHAGFSDPNGSYVRFSDHAAELARVEGERNHYRDDLTATRAELARVIAECERREKEDAEWKQRAEHAEAYVAGQDVRSDFQNAGEMRAELARVEAVLSVVELERDSLAKSIRVACTGSGCLNAHELRAAMDRTHKRATNAEKENTLLRAECEAWRAWFAWKFGDGNKPSDVTSKLIEARAATDAAKVLGAEPKGGE